jgi:hypothetical protein
MSEERFDRLESQLTQVIQAIGTMQQNMATKQDLARSLTMMMDSSCSSNAKMRLSIQRNLAELISIVSTTLFTPHTWDGRRVLNMAPKKMPDLDDSVILDRIPQKVPPQSELSAYPAGIPPQHPHLARCN